MKKVYKVPLYDYGYTSQGYSLKIVGEVIAVKTPFSVRELMTGYHLMVSYDKPKDVDYIMFNKYGHTPTVNIKDFVPKNLATPKDIDIYVENFEGYKFNEIYQEMKIFSIAEKVAIKKKVKDVFKSKK